MAFKAAVGQSRDVDGRTAGLRAAQQAMERLGSARAAFGWMIASHSYAIQNVLLGVNEALGRMSAGEVPLVGFSSSGELTAQGHNQRSVVVALISGDDVKAQAGWWPEYIHDTHACVRNMLNTLQPEVEQGISLLVLADGFNGDAAQLCSMLAYQGYALAGCLANGDLRRGKTFQVGGRRSGSGGLAAAKLGGDILMGVGAAHGWQPVGALARLTEVHGMWVRAIDQRPASETYARLFGYAARDWCHPPLTELARLYPLGLKQGPDAELVIRSPLRVEADGSLRMNAVLPEDHAIDFMIGGQQACRQAARQATLMALEDLGPTRPRLALVLVDEAWQKVFESNPGDEIRAVQEVLGEGVPIAGGYSLGQIARLGVDGPVHLLNQHMVVILFGERTVEV